MTNIGILADEATVTGFLLAGVGCIDGNKRKNFHVFNQNSPKAEIEAAFEEMINNSNISVIMASQSVMEALKDVVAECDLRGKVLMSFPTKESGLFSG